MIERDLVPGHNWFTVAYLWACERLYNELAWAYDVVSWSVSLGQWRRWQNFAWTYVIGRRIVELGCGTGAMLVQGRQRGYEMAGIDLSPAMAAHAQRRLARAGVEGRLLVGDGFALPFADEAHDTVMATFPAGYILTLPVLLEIRRVLRAGGRLVLAGLWVELDRANPLANLPFFYGRPSAQSLDTILNSLSAVGFQPHWEVERDGRFKIGILVADRKRGE